MDLNPLTQIDPVVIGGVFVIFWVTFAVLRTWVFVPYIRVMEERERVLESARATMAEAEMVSVRAAQEAERITAAARERAETLVRQAHEKAERYNRERAAQAGDEVGHLLEEGRAKIAAARENELAALRQQALECVGLACEKLVGEADPVVIEAAVDKLIARRVH